MSRRVDPWVRATTAVAVLCAVVTAGCGGAHTRTPSSSTATSARPTSSSSRAAAPPPTGGAPRPIGSLVLYYGPQTQLAVYAVDATASRAGDGSVAVTPFTLVVQGGSDVARALQAAAAGSLTRATLTLGSGADAMVATFQSVRVTGIEPVVIPRVPGAAQRIVLQAGQGSVTQADTSTKQPPACWNGTKPC